MPTPSNKSDLSKAVSGAYLRTPVDRADFNRFRKALEKLLDNVADGQREDTQKGLLKNFLRDTFYEPYYMAEDDGGVDLTIRLGKTAAADAGLIFELKSTVNKDEMPSASDLNRKALRELLLYYLRERVSKRNTNLRHLIVTNVFEFFVFDAQEFERKFYDNKALRRDFLDFAEGRKSGTTTEFFYSEIAAGHIDSVKDSLEYTYFNLADFRKLLHTEPAPPKLIALYKALSDIHLLKLPFQDDSNHLNRGFYNELLHIIGLEEKSDGGRTVIVRKAPGRRDEASLLENAINKIDAESCLSNIADIGRYGGSDEERLFNVALELCIVWMNRILFLKLLEAQMLRYNSGSRQDKFLTSDRMRGYDDLNTLFFQVLARRPKDRKESIAKRFGEIPYLNSSLFEVTALEQATIRISNLDPYAGLPLWRGSVLKKRGRPQPDTALDYLLSFLDAYDFASERSGGVREEAKTLISASVLGLIFEKINGHKDGSVFTPGFITTYMCRETITRAVLAKFNGRYGWDCASVKDLYNRLDASRAAEANGLINSIRICDPAAGSGHFLVSALNELIRLKYGLGILADSEGRLIRKHDYTVAIENDELTVTDAGGGIFVYNPRNAESRRIQETLFREKRTIIENCLFGVDKNPVSVTICRLRLWIELLKNACYTEESRYTELETLPNIDINIKCGNSLLSRFSVVAGAESAPASLGADIAGYRNAVNGYKNAPGKEAKRRLAKEIAAFKEKFREAMSWRDPLQRKLARLKKERDLMAAPYLSPEFGPAGGKAREEQAAECESRIRELEARIEKLRPSEMYRDAFEWMIEFPEMLDGEGRFAGFDIVIGNPPYIPLPETGAADALQRAGYKTFARTGDIYCLFYERGWQLLKDGGHLCYITSNKWMRARYGESTRRFLASSANPLLLVDFAGAKIFESATVDTGILLFSKAANEGRAVCAAVGRRNKDGAVKNLSDFVQQQSVECRFDSSDSWVILSPIEQSIKTKMESVGTPLKDWDIQLKYGIKTASNGTFIISTEKRNEILDNCTSDEERTKTAELIRPILQGRDIKRYGYDRAGQWLINTHNGIKGVKPRIKIEDYPAVKRHLDQYWDEIKNRTDQGDTPYNLRNCAYVDLFFQPKICWKAVGRNLSFAIVESGIFLAAPASFISAGKNNEYLLALLRSEIGKYFIFKNSDTTGAGDIMLNIQSLAKFPVPLEFDREYVSEIFRRPDREEMINLYVKQLYGFSNDEWEYIITYQK